MANELKRSKRIIIGDEEIAKQVNPENMKYLQRYLRDMEMRELSPKSIYSYKCDILAWFRYLVENQFNPVVTELTEDDIEEFIYFCKQEGNNTERIKRRLASLSAFYKFLRKKKFIKENPMEFIARPKKGMPVVTQTFLTMDQYLLMKEKLHGQDDLQLLVYGMFSISTMARVTAVSSIRWEQIDLQGRTVDDVLEKEGKIVTLYFSEEVRDLLGKLKQQREERGIDSPYVFISKYKGEINQISSNTLSEWAKKIGEMIGVPTLHPHDFRHSGSQLLSLSGMPIEKISELLNHSGLDVTKNHYLRQDKRKIQAEKDKYSF
jgi:integrase